MRIVACLFLCSASLDLYTDGWRSVEFVGSLLMALGMFAVSTSEEQHQSEPGKLRSPAFAIGLAVAVVGLGLQFFDRVAMR